MAFCANCGSEVQGKFCAKCGTPAAAPAGPPPGGAYAPPPPPAGSSAPPPPQGGYAPPPGGYAPPQGGYAPPQGGYAPPPPGGYAPPQGAYAPPPGAAPVQGLQENVAAALCYALWVLTGVLFLVLEPYNRNRNIRFHAFQAIFAWVAIVAIAIVFGIVSHIIAFMPFIGWIIVLLMWPVYGLGVFVLWLMLMYKAYNGERWVLPLIGPLAEKQAQA